MFALPTAPTSTQPLGGIATRGFVGAGVGWGGGFVEACPCPPFMGPTEVGFLPDAWGNSHGMQLSFFLNNAR